MAARVRFELLNSLKDGTDAVDALASRAAITATGITVTAEAGSETTSDFYPIAEVKTIRYYTGEIAADLNTRRDDPVPEV